MNNKSNFSPWLGCIADDYTGATDLASFLVASGLRTIQLNELPEHQTVLDISQYDAVVIALKSRTCAADVAVADSAEALKYLQDLGCGKFYFKYCSTFDSTKEGNIGPVIDALMSALDVNSALVCPALPVNGRTVYNGYLFVNGQLLNESPMSAHPLTPMQDAKLSRLIEAQGAGRAFEVNHAQVVQGRDVLINALDEASEQGNYVIVDALTMNDLAVISASVSKFQFITGGSGLAVNLAQEFQTLGGTLSPVESRKRQNSGHTVIFSGSCSTMTQAQVEKYQQTHPALQLNPLSIDNKQQSMQDVVDWMLENIDNGPLIYASADANTISHVHQTLGKDYAAELVENCFCELAKAAKQAGVQNFIVAGGETSGAVVQALDIKMFEIGPSIEPSVPIVTTIEATPINLALKSGNFGQPDFFLKAKRNLSCS